MAAPIYVICYLAIYATEAVNLHTKYGNMLLTFRARSIIIIYSCILRAVRLIAQSNSIIYM